MEEMLNNSKDILKQKNITYKEVAFILNISERQAMNILNKDNKGLFNYLVLAYCAETIVEEMFQLDKEEINLIKKRIDLLKANKSINDTLK